jgi:hypothetical protein
MSRLAFRVVTLVFGLAVLSLPTMAQETGIAPKLHPWGRFEPGTWKTVRVVTETLNEQGQVVSTSTTDTKTTLAGVDSAGVTLEVETCVEVAGKRFQSEPQTVQQGFHGEAIGPTQKSKEPVDGEITVEDRKIPCKIQEVTIDGPNGKTTVSFHCSMTVPLYVLKRVSVTTDPENKNTVTETYSDVIALDMPARIQGAMRDCAYVKTVHKTAKATVTTMAVLSADVPGGVVSQSSKEVDKDGKLVRRSTLDLLDYNTDPDKDRSGMFRQKRSSRRTKTPPRHGP